jgi:hypothetical protein
MNQQIIDDALNVAYYAMAILHDTGDSIKEDATYQAAMRLTEYAYRVKAGKAADVFLAEKAKELAAEGKVIGNRAEVRALYIEECLTSWLDQFYINEGK